MSLVCNLIIFACVILSYFLFYFIGFFAGLDKRDKQFLKISKWYVEQSSFLQQPSDVKAFSAFVDAYVEETKPYEKKKH